MSEADILARTYDDTVTVYRPQKYVTPDGETIQKGRLEGLKVYYDEPCALSGHNGGQTAQSASTASAPVAWYVFVRPEIDIRANDYLKVTKLPGTPLEKVEYLVAGEADRQPSHNRVPVKPDKRII